MKNYPRSLIEWERRIGNVGIIVPWPVEVLEDYLQRNRINDIIDRFWDSENNEVGMLDICTLMIFWWRDSSILKAATSWLAHPKFHYSELIFDKATERLILSFRQPDIDGKHWQTDHIHISVGKIDPNSRTHIICPRLKRKHIKLKKDIIPPNCYSEKGNFIVLVKENNSPDNVLLPLHRILGREMFNNLNF